MGEVVYTNHMQVEEAEMPKGWLLIEQVGLVDPDMLEFVSDSGREVPAALGVWLKGRYLFPLGSEIPNFALVLVCDPQRAGQVTDAIRASAIRSHVEPALQAEIDQATAARLGHFDDPRR